VLGQVILKPVRPKNVSAQTLQGMIAIKNYKGHMPTDIYLIGLGVGPSYSENIQAQKCFTPDLSGNNLLKNYEGHKTPNIDLMEVGVGPSFSKTNQSQK
jgi:hypothetical protein